jgi:Na+/H+-dicarboxylate symporter
MLLGFVVGSVIYYTNIFGDTLSNIVEVYAFRLGSDIFINLLKMLIVPLVFFFTCIWNILSWKLKKHRKYFLKDNYFILNYNSYSCQPFFIYWSYFSTRVWSKYRKFNKSR